VIGCMRPRTLLAGRQRVDASRLGLPGRAARKSFSAIALVGAPKLVASAIDNAPARRALGSMVSGG
jgi:hypothetical protein